MKHTFKKALSILLVIVIILSSAVIVHTNLNNTAIKAKAAQQKYESGHYTITINDGNATIVDFDSSIGGDIVIPSTLGGYPVRSIGDRAFALCDRLTSIKLSNTIKSIGDEAFSTCTRLTSITIGKWVTSIGDDAFELCWSLTDITVDPANTAYSSDEYGALYDKNKTELIKYPAANSRTNYLLPDSITHIDNDAFSDCDNFTSITVNPVNVSFSSDDYGVLFNKDKTELIKYPAANPRTSYLIPDSVTTICDSAFSESRVLASVLIPDSVTIIGDAAFYCCDSLDNISIPVSVTNIGDSAFLECDSLSGITIPDSVTNLGEQVFASCDRLSYAIIGNGVTNIGWSTFSDCGSLSSATIGNSVTSIDSYAFSSCYSLLNITIGNSVANIHSYAFSGCTNLTSITLRNSITYIGESAFRSCYDLTDIYYTGTKDEWNKIKIYNWENERFTNAKIHYEHIIEEETTTMPEVPTSAPATTKPTEVTTTKPTITEPSTTKPIEVTTTKPVTTVPTTTKPVEITTTKPDVTEPSAVKPTEPTTKPTIPPITEETKNRFEIRKPTKTEITYGDSIILHADFETKIPEGATVIWSTDNGNFTIVETSSNGTTCVVTPNSNGDTVFIATVIDANGTSIASDTQTMTSKAGFFQKIIAFFKKLFGATKVILE